MPDASAHSGPMPEDYFGEHVAETYEAKWPELFEPTVVEPAVAFLADLAGSGAALEFGIGTGRIALPLSRQDVRVQGIDLSHAMAAQLRAKPGAERIAVVTGDFATTRVDDTFALVYLVRNTITNLPTQEEQVECFLNAAAHLGPGGCFVIENYVPELRRLPPGETVGPEASKTPERGAGVTPLLRPGLATHGRSVRCMRTAAAGVSDALASEPAGSLLRPGWYANWSSDTEATVVFPRKIFHYPRGDQAGRADADAGLRRAG